MHLLSFVASHLVQAVQHCAGAVQAFAVQECFLASELVLSFVASHRVQVVQHCKPSQIICMGRDIEVNLFHAPRGHEHHIRAIADEVAFVLDRHIFHCQHL